MKLLLSNIFWEYIIPFINFIYYIFYRSKIVLVNGWSLNICSKVYHRNFGDDIVYDIVKYLIDDPLKKVLNLNSIMFKKYIKAKNYVVVGSVIDIGSCNSNTVVYGAGIMKSEIEMTTKPSEIIAVRGPLSRNYLINNGVHCPKIYMDSAFILKNLYKPNKLKKYKVGIIPHTYEDNLPILEELTKSFTNSVVISMKNYVTWRDVVDKMNECELILSSSLHGLIISDVYGIPNKQIKIFTKEKNKEVKFKDYFLGVGRRDMECIDLTTKENRSIDLQSIINNYQNIDVDLDAFIKLNPFKS